MLENILISSLVFAGFLTIFVTIYYFLNLRGIKAKKAYFEELHLKVVPGKKIIFCGGIYAKIINVNGDLVEVSLLDGTKMQINRYIISEIID